MAAFHLRLAQSSKVDVDPDPHPGEARGGGDRAPGTDSMWTLHQGQGQCELASACPDQEAGDLEVSCSEWSGHTGLIQRGADFLEVSVAGLSCLWAFWGVGLHLQGQGAALQCQLSGHCCRAQGFHSRLAAAAVPAAPSCSGRWHPKAQPDTCSHPWSCSEWASSFGSGSTQVRGLVWKGPGASVLGGGFGW